MEIKYISKFSTEEEKQSLPKEKKKEIDTLLTNLEKEEINAVIDYILLTTSISRL